MENIVVYNQHQTDQQSLNDLTSLLLYTVSEKRSPTGEVSVQYADSGRYAKYLIYLWPLCLIHSLFFILLILFNTLQSPFAYFDGSQKYMTSQGTMLNNAIKSSAIILKETKLSFKVFSFVKLLDFIKRGVSRIEVFDGSN